MNGLRVASYPGAFVTDSPDVMAKKFEDNVYDQIVKKLTEPTGGTKAGSKKGNSNIAFKGTLEEVNQHFRDMGWTDELPIIPPSIDKIQEFLKYTDYSADKEIAIVPQAMRRATPAVIAANGVMAGCKPEYMPLLIAMAETMADPYLNYRDLATTCMIVPYGFANGPIAKQLGVVSDIGAISRGPNPALGRALGLMVQNLGGFKPGKNYMASFGYFNRGFFVAEDEGQSPWKPFHVEEKGFDKNVSTVTLGGTMTWQTGSCRYNKDVTVMAKALSDQMQHTLGTYVTLFWREWDQNMVLVFMTPAVANMFAKAGWSKQDLIDWLWNNSYVTMEAIGGEKGIRALMADKTYGDTPAWFWKKVLEKAKEGPSAKIPLLVTKEEIHIVVTGDNGRDKLGTLWSWYNKPTTHEIKLPANWDNLMNKLGYPPLKTFFSN